MRAGDLRHRVSLQKQEIIKNELGGISKDSPWVNIAEVWADVRYVSGREFTKNGMDSSSSVVSIKVRRNKFSLQVDTNNRILFDGKIFNITAVLPDEVTKEAITFVCSQGLDEGGD